MNYVINRLKEPSTWTALGVIGALMGLPVGTVDAVHAIAGGVLALLGVLLPEGNHD